ncbi:MAG TPA: DEAD/DEAH box helicase [Verrucomicrobiae bacterium]|jgi:ATP-dependent Lhr-like helicase|nr:DEAD/DEAH box helicase [Verrucomicrobiae bacterium]
MPFSHTGFHPDVAAWCSRELGEPTPPQRAAIPIGLARRNVLICSPTGTGKTLAAFLPIFSSLATKRDADELFARTYALYISPLRALGYDVEHNLRGPLRAMELLERPNSERPRVRRGRVRERLVRTGVRTSDTPREERRLMLSRPPHILVTTPESLAVMLAMDSYRKTLRNVETVILDEVHALAGNKRGAHLSLLLESLEELTVASFHRVGLSATVAPLERVARYVAGADRPCEIVDCRGLRSIRIDIDAPFAGAGAPLDVIAQTAVDLTQDGRTTLIFTNVRSQAERVAHEMGRAIDQERIEVTADFQTPREYDRRIGVHHSALERSVRHRVEAALREGTLRAVVCSSSLELGVDIGFIDRVLIVGGARGVTSTLQRVGRAGHRPDAVACGVVIAQDRDDIVEAAATRRCIADGALEETIVPQAPLDVLAQWMVMSVCYDKRTSIDDLHAVAARAFPFASVPRADLVDCARYLSGGGVGDDPAHVRRLGFDGEAIYGLGREVCAAYFDNVGTIPDEKHIGVRILGGDGVGRLEEGFVNELRAGDVFVLNGSTLRVKEIGTTGVVAEPFVGRPTVPQWSSHMKGVGPLLAAEIANLRVGVARRLARGPTAALTWLSSRYGLTGAPAAHVVAYVAQQRAISAVPELTRPIVEIYRMDRKQTAVFHTCAGRRVNETLARAVGARVMARLRVGASITTDDNGFLVTLPLGVRLPDAVWASMLAASGLEADVLAGVRSTHLLKNHFRYVANTGLLVLRRAAGRSLRRGTQAWNSGRILERVASHDPRFPLLRETMRTVTRDLLDLPGALEYVARIDGEPRVLHPPAASPFTFGILTSSFGDSVLLDDRAAMVQALHDRVLQLLGEDETAYEDGPALALRYS